MNTLDVRPIDILVVEDNADDAALILEVLKNNKIHNSVNVVKDGIEAMDFLHREGKYVNAPRPDLILLDLNLPKKDGREVLSELKSSKEFKQIPVVVMTISESEKDILESYNLHANCYVTKPINLDQFIKVVESIEDFWFTMVNPPKE